MPRLLRAKVVGGRRNPCGKQKLKKSKNAFSKKACGHATQKRSGKPRVCEPKSKNLEVTPNVPKAFFSSEKIEKRVFGEMFGPAPRKKSRNVGKIGCVDDWHSQEKSVNLGFWIRIILLILSSSANET